MTICPACGAENPEHARYCHACGRALEEAPAREERKVVSVLFVDLVGFTGRSDRADPEDVRALLRPYHAQLKQEIERFGGTVEKFIGDAVMAVFGAPVAHEDDAERAVRAGLRILDELPPELTVRAAVDTGEAVVSLTARPEVGEGIVAGDVVNTASRLQGAAPAGSLVVGEATYRATRRAIEYEEFEPVTVKGKTEPIPIWRAVSARSRFGVDLEPAARTPFVGRQHELALLKETFARAERGPSVQLITVVGEPGVGKSRLVAEFRQFLDDRPEIVTWRQGRCLPYGEGITFWALGEIVKAQAGILESDSPEEARLKLDAALEGEAEREWLAARLVPLVGVAGQGEAGQQESFTAWRRFLESLAATRPLVAVFEDLQWADAALLDFLEHVVDWGTDVPLLLVCTARPELSERRPGWGGGKRNSTTISPAPLTEEETDRLLDALLPSVLPAETRAAVLERSEGNPLFAEEFARLVVERADAEVPETVQALIAARLDTLDAERKALLQDAAVVGKIFWAGAVAAMSGRADVATALRDLVRRDLIRPARVSSVEGEEELAFWHGLVRDVAYQQIPRAERARRHRVAADWIERIAGDRVADHAEILAHHYGEAVEYARAAGEDTAELADAARRFLVMAGGKALHLDARKAHELYGRALAQTPPGHPDRPRILCEAAWTGQLVGDFVEAQRHAEEAVDLLRGGDDPAGLVLALVRLARILWRRGDTERSEQLLTEAERLVERIPPGPEALEFLLRMSGQYMMRARYRECVECSERGLAMARTLGSVEFQSILQFRGVARCGLGDLEGGIADLREAAAHAEAAGFGLPTGVARGNLADVLWTAEGPQSALDCWRDSIEFARRRGLNDTLIWQEAETVWPLFDLGRWDELLTVAERVLDWDREQEGTQTGALVLPYQARIAAARGRVAEAGRLAEEFLPRCRAIGDPQVILPALVAGAEIEVARGRPEAARALVEELPDASHESGVFGYRYLAEAARICAATGTVGPVEAILARDAVGARSECARLSALAVVAEVRGDAEEAAAGYRDAADAWGALGCVVERAHALLGLWRCAGDEAALAEGREIFASLGAQAATEAPLGPAAASRPK